MKLKTINLEVFGICLNLNEKKAIIISIKGPILSPKERTLFSNERPWGLILFKRNIISLNQIKKLISEIKKISKDKKFPILIDEEGSSVSRLKNILNHNFDANYFGNLYNLDNKVGLALYKKYLESLCKNLKEIGINVNTIPVLDVLRKNTNKIIGKRAFSKNKKIVQKLGEVAVRKCHSQKIITVIKHIPGHGCSSEDSHLILPKVNFNIDL